jgi:hypothetical protein
MHDYLGTWGASKWPEDARRALIMAGVALLAVLAILGAYGAAQSTPTGTPIPACVSDGSGPVQPCHWDARP